MLSASSFRWINTGDEAFREMLDAIHAAKNSVRFEMYIYDSGPLGVEFRDGLMAACKRGVAVHVLVDAMGSIKLSENFWREFKEAGGYFRWFNRLTFARFGMRNHRKNLVCDESVAFVGGFNVAPEYQGDGVHKGWRDLGMRISGPLAKHLAVAFDDIFAKAEFKPKPFSRLRKSSQKKIIHVSNAELLLSAPGRLRNPLKRALRQDLARARSVQILCAYFLPTWRIRGQLHRIARHGGRVQLVLPGQSDVPLSRLAARSLYQRMMNAGIEIYEYQPQILHAKMIIFDHAVYAGSANLDIRSLHLNYELLVRVTEEKVVSDAREIFSRDLEQCKRIEPEDWKRSRTFLGRLKERWAHFVLARLDPLISRHRWKEMR
ncbi:MAG: phospholipase D-like domain-containing protein [Verrucomicrobiota bacterium]